MHRIYKGMAKGESSKISALSPPPHPLKVCGMSIPWNPETLESKQIFFFIFRLFFLNQHIKPLNVFRAKCVTIAQWHQTLDSETEQTKA